jgi:hypothetical protein
MEVSGEMVFDGVAEMFLGCDETSEKLRFGQAK